MDMPDPGGQIDKRRELIGGHDSSIIMYFAIDMALDDNLCNGHIYIHILFICIWKLRKSLHLHICWCIASPHSFSNASNKHRAISAYEGWRINKTHLYLPISKSTNLHSNWWYVAQASFWQATEQNATLQHVGHAYEVTNLEHTKTCM